MATAARERSRLAAVPTPRDEDWKYTSLKRFTAKTRRPHQLQIVQIETRALGAKLRRLSQLAGPEAETIRRLFPAPANTAPSARGYFHDLATGLCEDPYVLWLETGTEAAEINWISGGAGAMDIGVLYVLLPAGCQATLVENYGENADALVSRLQVHVAKGASLEHVRLQMGGPETTVIASVTADVERDASYRLTTIGLGAALARETIDVHLREAGATTDLNGLILASGNQHVDHHTNIEHAVGDTTSRQLYKTILAGESRGVFNGRIAIGRGAVRAQAAQMNRNLLLSQKAEIDTKPQLEIDNDDVKATHGATIGRLDPEHIFYLRSRGLSLAQASRVLAGGFALEMIESMSSKELRQRLHQRLDLALAALTLGES